MNVLAASQLFIEQIRQSRAPDTTEAYTYAVRAFVAYVSPETECAGLTWQHFTGFVTDVLRGAYARSTMGIYAVCLRGFMRFLVSQDLTPLDHRDFIKVDYALEACRSERPPRQPKVPTDTAVQAIIQAAYRATVPSPLRERNIALVECLFCTGSRIRELAGLTISDISFETALADIMGKGHKPRQVYMSPRALAACRAYWLARREQDPGSPAFARHDDGAGKGKPLRMVTTAGLRQVIHDLSAQAGVGDFTPHSFRHFFATRLLRETGNLAVVQDALGHAKPDTTRVYARLDAAMVRLAVQQVFGSSPVQTPQRTPARENPAPTTG
jgi:integrase/recombinase XerC